jgi:hypothetical protein
LNEAGAMPASFVFGRYKSRVFADESLRRRTTTASNFDWRFLPLHAIDQRKK